MVYLCHFQVPILSTCPAKVGQRVPLWQRILENKMMSDGSNAAMVASGDLERFQRCVFFFSRLTVKRRGTEAFYKRSPLCFSWFPTPFSSETCGLRIIMCSNKIDTRVDCPIYSKGTLPLLQMHLCIQDGSPMMQRYWNLQGFSWQ